MQRKQGTSRLPAPSKSGASKGKQPPAKCGAAKGNAAGPSQGQGPSKERGPAFSIPLPVPKTAKEQQKAKQKMIRRNKPAGEDLEKLKKIVKTIRDKITVQEYIGLLAPSTGDNADVLRSVLAEELATFRTTSQKIYETMTQDINDVLTNEQIQLKEYSEERVKLYDDKMQRNLNEIFALCPTFDFDKFFTVEGYLDEMFPVAPEVDFEAVQAIMRQEAYHRYQWLKSEGERLKEENTRLKKRLNQLKKQQKEELRGVLEREQQAEDDRKQLEAKQEELEERLEELNESVGKTLVETELEEADTINLDPIIRKPKISLREEFKSRRSPQQNWAAQQAAEMEASKTTETLHAETSKISLRAKTTMSKSAIKKKTKRAPRRQQQEAFHYSPIKTPPRPGAGEARPASPFHYSPIKTPPPATSAATSTSPHYSADRSDYTRFQSGISPSAQPQGPGVRTSTQEQGPRIKIATSSTVTEQQINRGRAQGPRDTWGGFN